MKQLKYPKEFRIKPIKLDSDAYQVLHNLLKEICLKELKKTEQFSSNEFNHSFYSEIATNLWRIKKNMMVLVNNKTGKDLSMISRHIESIELSLKQVGIEIYDHDNEDFDSGRSLSVLTFQPMEGFTKEIILETIKPTIFLNEKRIQMGVVIVATPL